MKTKLMWIEMSKVQVWIKSSFICLCSRANLIWKGHVKWSMAMSISTISSNVERREIVGTGSEGGGYTATVHRSLLERKKLEERMELGLPYLPNGEPNHHPINKRGKISEPKNF